MPKPSISPATFRSTATHVLPSAPTTATSCGTVNVTAATPLKPKSLQLTYAVIANPAAVVKVNSYAPKS